MSATPAALAEQLRALGVEPGGLVMVHASLRAIGPVHGRADGVVDALLEAVGPSGTLLMVLGADADEPFDATTTEVDVEDMGVLAEVFRRRAGPQVSDHPAARMAAIGKLAGPLLADSPLHHYYGPGSPLQRFVGHGGTVLRLGADIDSVTLTHWAEYQASVPNKRAVRRRYVRADTGELFIDSLDDSDGIAVWPHGDYFAQIMRDYLGAGHAAVGPVGACTAELLDGPHFVAFAIAWMNEHLGPPDAGES